MIGVDDRTKIETFEEINKHLMEDDNPSEYIIQRSQEPIFQEYPFEMLLQLKDTEQSPKHHPEGSVWNHTMLVVDEAAKVKDQSKDPEVFMWAALLHDIGKPPTTRKRKGKITSYDHDKVGVTLCSEFLENFTSDKEFVKKVCALVRYHMHMLYVLNKLPYGDPESLVREVDIHDMSLLSRCDRLGRTGANIEEEERNYQEYKKALERHSKARG